VIQSLTEVRSSTVYRDESKNDAKFFDHLLFQACLALEFQIVSFTFRRRLNRRHAVRAQSPPNDKMKWDVIIVQHQYKNCTTTFYMRVDLSM
jgi:hypothetical protein